MQSERPPARPTITLATALRGLKAPAEIRRELRVVVVPYWSFDHKMHHGYLLVHRELAAEVTTIFREIAAAHFPIEKVVPMTEFRWSDDASMQANNTSAFNYRNVPGKPKLSQHAYGRAIDINPRLNPYESQQGTLPPGAKYRPALEGTLAANGVVLRAFRKRGWFWGGRWKHPDWQHFEKQMGEHVANTGNRKYRPHRAHTGRSAAGRRP